MKRLFYCILICGFLFSGINSAYAETSFIASNSSDIQVSATVIRPIGFVTMNSERGSQMTGRAYGFISSSEISVMTSGNALLEIDNGQKNSFLISSETFGLFTFDSNLLSSNIALMISTATTDSSLCLITLITITD